MAKHSTISIAPMAGSVIDVGGHCDVVIHLRWVRSRGRWEQRTRGHGSRGLKGPEGQSMPGPPPIQASSHFRVRPRPGLPCVIPDRSSASSPIIGRLHHCNPDSLLHHDLSRTTNTTFPSGLRNGHIISRTAVALTLHLRRCTPADRSTPEIRNGLAHKLRVPECLVQTILLQNTGQHFTISCTKSCDGRLPMVPRGLRPTSRACPTKSLGTDKYNSHESSRILRGYSLLDTNMLPMCAFP